MCLMLYVGTSHGLPPVSSPDLRVEDIGEGRHGVRRWFSQPVVQFVGAHTGCSCGFPSVIADVPIDYYEGMPLDSDDRAADLRSVAALIALLRDALRGAPCAELYPVADGDEAESPKGQLHRSIEHLIPDRFFFNERFMLLIWPEGGHP